MPNHSWCGFLHRQALSCVCAVEQQSDLLNINAWGMYEPSSVVECLCASVDSSGQTGTVCKLHLSELSVLLNLHEVKLSLVQQNQIHKAAEPG
jgi:hypothetical protein